MKLNGYIGTITDKTDYLIKDGKTDYTILLPKDASEAEEYAALDMKEFFEYKKVEIKIEKEKAKKTYDKVIAIGNTTLFKDLNLTLKSEEFKFDGYIIESVGSSYVIKGVGDTGTRFGVYGFAEYIMGYVFYTPDEYAIKEGDIKNKEFHIKDIPTFFGRNAYSYDTQYNNEYGFRLRINGEYCERSPRHGEGRPWSILNDQSNTDQILNCRVYYKDHPEWYVLHENEKDFDKPCHLPQICYSKGLLHDSEGGFFDTYVNNLINNFIIPESDKSFFMLGMSDNSTYCECEECKKAVAKYTRSGLAMKFVNKVADYVENWRKENAPDRVIYVVSFAYLSIFEPPVIEKKGKFIPVSDEVIARDNVIIQYAPIRANYKYPLTDEKHNGESKRSILGWSTVAKHMAVWDYRQDFGTQTFFYPTTVTAQENNDLYAKLGFMDIFNQAQPFTSGSPFMEMDNFARARIHWNAKENYKELCNEFMKAYYKDAHKEVAEYLHAFEKYYDVMEKRGWTGAIGSGAAVRKDLHTVKDMYDFKAILDKALVKAKNIKDVETRKKVIKRVEALTLFYKFVLVLCFPLEIEKSEAVEIVKDLGRICAESGLTLFYRRITSNEYLSDATAILEGKVTEATRRFPLRTK